MTDLERLEADLIELLRIQGDRVREGAKASVSDYEALTRCLVALRASGREDVKNRILAADFVAKVTDPGVRERLKELLGIERPKLETGDPT